MKLTTATAIIDINKYNVEGIVTILTNNGYKSYGMTLEQLQLLGYKIDYVSVYPTDMEYLLMSKPMPCKHSNIITAHAFIRDNLTFKTASRHKSGYTITTPQQDYDQYEMDAIRRDMDQMRYEVVAIAGTKEQRNNY